MNLIQYFQSVIISQQSYGNKGVFMEFYRGRRLRGSAALRDLMAETKVTANDLKKPYFLHAVTISVIFETTR